MGMFFFFLAGQQSAEQLISMPETSPRTSNERKTRWPVYGRLSAAAHNQPHQRRETASPLRSAAGRAALAARADAKAERCLNPPPSKRHNRVKMAAALVQQIRGLA